LFLIEIIDDDHGRLGLDSRAMPGARRHNHHHVLGKLVTCSIGVNEEDSGKDDKDLVSLAMGMPVIGGSGHCTKAQRVPIEAADIDTSSGRAISYLDYSGEGDRFHGASRSRECGLPMIDLIASRADRTPITALPLGRPGRASSCQA